MATPIHIHPDNPKLFEFRGQPLVLLTATEHYGAVMNRPFRFERYLADTAAHRMTLTRLFTLFRELQSANNPYSTCKPETPDYIAPFVRTGPGRACDQEWKYDLDRPNPEYFERLHRFVALASDYGIVVEVVLLSNTYAPHIWELNPLNARNNINGLEGIEWPDYLSQRWPKSYERQVSHIQKIVTELNPYDNLIYEICNEPGGRAGGRPDTPSVDEVNQWLSALIRAVRETEARLPNQHLIAGQEAFCYDPWEQRSDVSFHALNYDVVNMHPLPNTTYGGQSYPLGDFMSKQLTLRALRDYALATSVEPKPLNQDEDNVASQYKDVDAWTIHRKRAWTTLLSGGHYDYIDFSITPYSETGTPESRQYIRLWMQYLSDFIHAIDLVHARPLRGLVKEQPANTLDVVFGVVYQDYYIYLADERELAAARGLSDGDQIERDAGQPITGHIVFDVQAGPVSQVGRYQAAFFEPASGVWSAPSALSSAADGCVRLQLPPFVHDLVVHIHAAKA